MILYIRHEIDEKFDCKSMIFLLLVLLLLFEAFLGLATSQAADDLSSSVLSILARFFAS